MALSFNRISVTADAVADVCNQLATLLATVDQLLEFNSDQNIGWTDDPLPGYITEDGDGNITGKQFARGDVSNALGSLTQFRNLMTNQAVSQGDHLGNVNKLAKPLG